MTGPQAAAHRDRRDDLATYALGALGEAEAAALEAHLASCADCRRYLDELRPGIDLLAASVPQLPPPPALRERLLTTVDAEAERIADASSPAPRRRRRSWRGLAVRPATALAAAFVLLAGAAVGYILHGSSGSGRSVTPAHPTPAAPPGSVSASLARVDGSGTLEVRRMPPLPGRDVYEVWTKRGPALRPESTFVLRRDGSANAAVPDLSGASAVLVTREPHGGSQHPTSPPLLRASL
jgi:anti-sigma-K factor RskA